MERPLSELLKLWRAERPDEWTMDEFIREAERMEKQLQNTSSNSDYAKYSMSEYCEWTKDEFEGFYQTLCDKYFTVINDESLKDNNINYCYNCGKKIKEVKN